MFVNRLIVLSGICFYVIASIIAVISLVKPSDTRERGIRCLAIIGGVLFIAALVLRGIELGRIPVFSRFGLLVCYSIALSAAYFHIAVRHDMRGISGILIPYVTVLLILGVFGGEGMGMNLPLKMQTFCLGLHIFTAFIGYSLFTLASILAVAYLLQDNNLKHKRFGVLFERLPALETLDHVMCQQIGFAFLMLSISIVLGVKLIHTTGGGPEWFTDPKVAATIATWIVYAVLLYIRTSADRHGKKIALAIIVGIFFILFASFGVHVVADSVHDFMLTDAGTVQ